MGKGALLSGDSQYLQTASPMSPKRLFLSPVISGVEGWPGLPPWASAPGEIPEQLGETSKGLFLTETHSASACKQRSERGGHTRLPALNPAKFLAPFPNPHHQSQVGTGERGTVITGEGKFAHPRVPRRGLICC